MQSLEMMHTCTDNVALMSTQHIPSIIQTHTHTQNKQQILAHTHTHTHTHTDR